MAELTEAQETKVQAKETPEKVERSIAVLGHRRAMPMEVAWKKVKITPAELVRELQAMDLNSTRLESSDVERLLGKMPDEHESKAIKAHAKEFNKLRQIEQLVFPLTDVSDSERRLRIIIIAKTHEARYNALVEYFESAQMAASEVRHCERLHSVLRTALQMLNFINHGTREGAQSFPVSSFATLANFKLKKRSALHFLCSSMSDDLMPCLESDLKHVFLAARGSTQAQKEEIDALRSLYADVRQHVKEETDESAKGSVVELQGKLDLAQARLQQSEVAAKAGVGDAQRFLGERVDGQMPNEEFFSHIVQIVNQLKKGIREVLAQREKESKLDSASTASAASTPRSSRAGSLGLGPSFSFAPAQIFSGSKSPTGPTSPSDAAVRKLLEVAGTNLERLPAAQHWDKTISWVADGVGVQGAIQALNEATSIY